VDRRGDLTAIASILSVIFAFMLGAAHLVRAVARRVAARLVRAGAPALRHAAPADDRARRVHRSSPDCFRFRRSRQTRQHPACFPPYRDLRGCAAAAQRKFDCTARSVPWVPFVP
jgi:hypothetical protein